MTYRFSKRAMYLAGKTDTANSGNWLPLWQHLHDTMQIMEKLILLWLPESTKQSIALPEQELRKLARFLGGVHDIGKATLLFQHNIMRHLPLAGERLWQEIPVSAVLDGKLPHSMAGEIILRTLDCPKGIASIVGTHHGLTQGKTIGQLVKSGKITDKRVQPCLWGNTPAAWQQLWQEIYQFALQESGYGASQDLPQLSISAQIILTGLLIMADWIASNMAYFPSISQEDFMSADKDRANKAWKKFQLTYPWEPEQYAMDEAGFQERFGFPPNAVQRAMADLAETVPSAGIFILEAPMGKGKTEAALAACEILASRFGCGGIFFGLPTQGTANGIFSRMEAWAEKESEDTLHSMRLAHGLAELNEAYCRLPGKQELTIGEDEAGGVFVHEWFSGSKQALLADFVLGTVDQLLMAALKQKHVMLRHLGLAGKVVIVDECHAYDAYMNGYLDKALSWLGAYRVPVVLLSATLPGKRRQELIAAYQNKKRRAGQADKPMTEQNEKYVYPVLSYAPWEGEIQQIAIDTESCSKAVQIISITEADLAAMVQERLLTGACVGIIVNTVKKAQKLAEYFMGIFPEADILLMHAQFIQEDRGEKEKLLLQRLGKQSSELERKNLLVIGTQVLEQSLDIDFDFLVTELCPMDLLLQRIGRLHRHQRQRPAAVNEAICAVLDTGEDDFDAGSAGIYTEWLLWRTRRLLPEKFVLPKDIPVFVENTYEWETGDVLETTPVSQAYLTAYEGRKAAQQRKSGVYQIKRPQEHKKLPRLNVLDGWMEQDDTNSETAARAAVRDSEPSLEVLLMVRKDNGKVHFLPWVHQGAEVPRDEIPSSEESLWIARQRLRLPVFFCHGGRIDRVIKELETVNAQLLGEWQHSPLLRGELVLLLDEDLTVTLDGDKLAYTRAEGLVYGRKEQEA